MLAAPIGESSPPGGGLMEPGGATTKYGTPGGEPIPGRPFDPGPVVVASFFCGPIGGGWIVNRNFRALGMPGPARLFAVASLALTLVMGAVGGPMIGEALDRLEKPAKKRGAAPRPDPKAAEADRDDRWLFRTAFQAGAAALAIVAARVQRVRYREFLVAGGAPRPLFKIGLFVFLVNIPLTLVVFWLGAAIMPAR